MQKTLVLILAIGFAICVVPQNTISQDTQDWHLRHLPRRRKSADWERRNKWAGPGPRPYISPPCIL